MDWLRGMPFEALDNVEMEAAAPGMNVLNQNNPFRRRQQRAPILVVDEQVTPYRAAFTRFFEFRWNPNELTSVDDALYALSMLIDSMVAPLPRSTMVRLRFEYEDRVASTRLYSVADIRYLLANVEELVQALFHSNEDAAWDDVRIYMDLRDALRGGFEPMELDERASFKEQQRRIQATVPRYLQNYQGVVWIANQRNTQNEAMCGWLAVAYHFLKQPDVFLAPLNYLPVPHRPKLQQMRWLAVKLKEQFQGDHAAYTHPYHSEKLVQQFPKLRIGVVEAGTHMPNELVKGVEYQQENHRRRDQWYHLYLLHDRDHWHYIHQLQWLLKPDLVPSMVGQWQACHACFQVLSLQRGLRHERVFWNHTCCEYKCLKCNAPFPDERALDQHQQYERNEDTRQIGFKCVRCKFICYNASCYEYHVDRNCRGTAKECPHCHVLLYPKQREQHHCQNEDQYECPECHMTMDSHLRKYHECFMERLPLEADNAETITDMFVFDFESAFESMPDHVHVDPEQQSYVVKQQLHKVNFVAVRQLFTGREWTFETLNEFHQWLMDVPDGERILIAHNMKGYDGRLLFDHFLLHNAIPETIMWRGRKIMKMRSPGYFTIMDSLLHITASLEQFPKIFGLDETEFAKGFFPYQFNRHENRHYTGPIVDRHFFEPEHMPAKKQAEFNRWYVEQQQSGEPYIFWDELVKYCLSDVRILAKSMEVYIRESILLNEGLNPMRSTTIAAYAMRVYKTLHMPERTLAPLTRQQDKLCRQAMHGGRTDVRQMFRQWTPEQMDQGRCGRYLDVQSLYPYVQFTKPMPVGRGRSETFARDQQPSLDQVRSWLGVVECRLSIERYLHHPIVMTKADNKLMARLDLPEEEWLVLTTAELHCALDHGYRLLEVRDVVLFEASTALFQSYIQTYLRIKIECSGMPKHIQRNPDEWAPFAQYHREHLGIELDPSRMVANAGRKQIAKLMLNSLWGKFAEGSGHTVHKVCRSDDVTQFHRMDRMWLKGDIDVQYRFTSSNGKQTVFLYRETDKMMMERHLNRVHLALAAFVTAWGRLTLWEQMHQLGERVLYHDTDSIVYEHIPGAYNIPMGRYLGDWECETGGDPIQAFVSTGPKTYAYRVARPHPWPSDEQRTQWRRERREFQIRQPGESVWLLEDKCKAKGFTLKGMNADRVHFASLLKLLNREVPYLQTQTLAFHYDRDRSQMLTRRDYKYLRYTYAKGHVDPTTFQVLPFGYERFQ